MSLDKYLAYRGTITDLIGLDRRLMWSVNHTEKNTGALYRLTPETLAMDAIPLPCGATTLAVVGKNLFIAGEDKKLYQCPLNGKKITVFCEDTGKVPVQIVRVSNNRPAVLADDTVLVLEETGEITQTLSLPAKGTALAADPSGQWLVAGTESGSVSVFEEENGEFVLSEADQLHESAVTALVFETGETRFLSAGLDQRLLSTHARGRLEPEDRGRGFNHADRLVTLLQGTGERFYSGGHDKTIKAWPKNTGGRPATIKEGIGKVTALALVTLHKQPHLAAACQDNTIALFPVDAAGKPGQYIMRIRDAYALAAEELKSKEVQKREKALKELAGYGDTRAYTMIARQMDQDADLQMRITAMKWIGKSKHTRAAGWLEPCLKDREAKVRTAAFEHLKKMSDPADFRLADLAFAAKKADVGQAAVALLETRAKKEDRALKRLTDAVSTKPFEVRQAALFSLEKVFPKKNPDASFRAFSSPYSDLRRLALIRLLHRNLLDQAPVQQVIRRATEDEDATVRRTAFLLTLLIRKKLVEVLRERDPDIHRELMELAETGKTPAKPSATDLKPAKTPKKTKPKKWTSPDLAPDDYLPLLHAMSSRPSDTCLAGAMGLAFLGDGRALGLLLQLSREEDSQTRVAVCRSFAMLGDPRCLQCLERLLNDESASVRDAAFTALTAVYDDSLSSAEAGMDAAKVDVRLRALSLLIRKMRKAKTFAKTFDGPLARLTVRALNDDEPKVRQEAFKAVFNLREIREETLRFLRKSVHADIRTDVLTEIMAREKTPWADRLLLEYFDDPEPALRAEAFDYALKKNEGTEEIPLKASIRARYADIRKKTVNRLSALHTPASQELLVEALADEDRDVRKNALDILVRADAGEALSIALSSRYTDVRVRAAVARARHGDSAAKTPLLELLQRPEPETKDAQKNWIRSVCGALEGLGALGDASVLPQVTPLLDAKEPAIRKAAADTMVWVGDTPALQAALSHADPQVRDRAALGMAYAGDSAAVVLLYSKKKVLTETDRLTAAVVLAAEPKNQKGGLSRLQTFLDSADPVIRTTTLNALMLMELADPGTSPGRCITCLASKMPRIRLEAAKGLETFPVFKNGLRFVTEMINHRGDEPPWTLSEESLLLAAKLLIHAQPRLRAKTASLLFLLRNEKPDAWQQAWSIHQQRYAESIAKATAAFEEHDPSEAPYDPEPLAALAFGAYVGLVREQGSYHQRRKRPGIGSSVIRVRQRAISCLVTMAQNDPLRRDQVVPVFVQALSDPNQAVRESAFDGLQELKMKAAELGTEALAAGYTDMGTFGLQLLTKGVSGKKAEEILERAMSARTDGLEEKAAELLMALKDEVAVARQALGAASKSLRQKAVSWLSKASETQSEALDALREALENRHLGIRLLAAATLTTKKDPAVFDALKNLLFETRKNRQDKVIRLLRTLDDSRVPGIFLDRIENDPEKTAQTSLLFAQIGEYRDAAVVERLFEKMDDYFTPAFGAILTISGYDQSIEDPEDDNPDKTWLEKQYCRNDEILSRLLARCLEKNADGPIRKLIPGARWSPTTAADPVLSSLAGFPDDRTRHLVTEAIGWRLRKRKASAEPLVRLLEHRDTHTRFLAAEGLAKAGRADGIQILLSGIELLDDFDLRTRAVEALGELGDERALDILLRLAGEEDHALQETAIAAIGHMGRSPKAEEIFELLSETAEGDDGRAEQALVGLRWFDTPDAWQRIRMRAADTDFEHRETAVSLLGHHDDDANRKFLIRLLEQDQSYWVVSEAYDSALRLWATEDLTPQYALAKGRHPTIDDDLIERLNEKGDAEQLFEIIAASADEEIKDGLAEGLFTRSPLPMTEAGSRILDNSPKVVETAAQIMGQAADPNTEHHKRLAEVLDKWAERWTEHRQKMQPGKTQDKALDDNLTPCLMRLVWSAGRLGVGRERLLTLCGETADPLFQPIRKAAFDALAKSKPVPAFLDLARNALIEEDAGLRLRAAEIIGCHDQQHAEQAAEKLLFDRIALRQLGSRTSIRSHLASACTELHYQGVTLPYLTRPEEIETLFERFFDMDHSDTVRMGIVEGLAKSACETAEAMLAKIGQSEETPEALRKAAWRGLRRSRRERAKKREKRA